MITILEEFREGSIRKEQGVDRGVTDERSVDLKGNREVNSEDKMTTQIDRRSLFSLFLLLNSPTLYHSLSFRYSRISPFFPCSPVPFLSKNHFATE